jgi:hypothetical protein
MKVCKRTALGLAASLAFVVRKANVRVRVQILTPLGAHPLRHSIAAIASRLGEIRLDVMDSLPIWSCPCSPFLLSPAEFVRGRQDNSDV